MENKQQPCTCGIKAILTDTSTNTHLPVCPECYGSNNVSDEDAEWIAYCAEMRRRELAEEAYYADYEPEVVLQCDTYDGYEW